MGKTKTAWLCSECGNESYQWSGACHACKSWNTLKEFTVQKEVRRSIDTPLSQMSAPVAIGSIEEKGFERVQLAFRDLNRLMGEGVVKGSLNLVGGAPGIGKSTMMLHIAEQFASLGYQVLYVSGEESLQQTSMRAKRLGVDSASILLLSETDFTKIKYQVQELKPDVFILDSIQIVYKPEIASVPGSVTQVKEVSMECMHLAKGMGMTTFLIGHVTKSGDLAGPRVLEHIVDTVLEFEGDHHQGYRIMRSNKNRFGPTDEVAIFQMDPEGLSEILNPSEAFLEERSEETSGSVVAATLEGTRGILIEVQALVAPSTFSTSSRKASGIDQNRLALLLAVLEKRMGYHFPNLDVFVSIAGGMKIFEPAVDLAVILAISSSFTNRTIPHDVGIVGEVGLGGEVRSVSRIENRVKELINMGFTTCLLPHRNAKGLSKTLGNKIKLVPVKRVEEAVNYLLG